MYCNAISIEAKCFLDGAASYRDRFRVVGALQHHKSYF